MLLLFQSKLLHDGFCEGAKVFPVHRQNEEFSIEFYLKVRAFARREGCPLFVQPAL